MNTIKKKTLEQVWRLKPNVVRNGQGQQQQQQQKQFALIPLLKTINYSIKDEKDENKKNLKEALKEAAIFTLGISQDIISSIVTNYAGKELGGLFKKSLDDVTSKLIPQLKSLKKLSEADRNSIFYLGIDNIQKALDAIRRDKRDFRVVIFIDDLDRCSPSKTLEVLESMKIFLSLDGIEKLVNDVTHKLKVVDRGNFITIYEPAVTISWALTRKAKKFRYLAETVIITESLSKVFRVRRYITETALNTTAQK